VLTIWPRLVCDLSYCDRVVWVCLLHLGIQDALHVCRTVVALKVASLSSKTSSHVHSLGPRDLEPVSLRVLPCVQQLKVFVLEGRVECVVLFARRNLPRPCRSADVPVQNGEGFLLVVVVVCVRRACPGVCV